MPYVIKHKTKDRYVSNTKSTKVEYDEDGLTGPEFARIYPTRGGARSALIDWSKYWDTSIKDEENVERLKSQGVGESIAQRMGFSRIAINQSKVDLVHIVEVEMIKSNE